MPYQSQRAQLLKELEQAIIFTQITWCTMMCLGFPDNNLQDYEDFITVLMTAYACVASNRYMDKRTYSIPKNRFFADEMILRYPDEDFRQIVRMSKASFVNVLRLIEHHHAFQNNSRNKQRAGWVQLAIALERLGCFGNGASVGRFARQWGISDGSVVLYTQRIIRILVEMEEQFVRWPGKSSKLQLPLNAKTHM